MDYKTEQSTDNDFNHPAADKNQIRVIQLLTSLKFIDEQITDCLEHYQCVKNAIDEGSNIPLDSLQLLLHEYSSQIDDLNQELNLTVHRFFVEDSSLEDEDEE